MVGRDWLASGAAAAVAVTVFALVPATRVPQPLARAVGGEPGAPIHLRGGTRVELSIPPDATAEQRHALARDLQRRGARVAGQAEARLRGDIAVVDATGALPVSDLLAALTAEHSLSMKRVDNDTELMRQIGDVVDVDLQAPIAGVTAQQDYWQDDSGVAFHDQFLQAPRRDLLRDYLAALFYNQPDLKPPADHEIAIECPNEPGAGRCRTYYLVRKPWLTDADIVDARVEWNRLMNQPDVLVTFTHAGGQRFGELTGANVGRKLAILVDGAVTSAPVIVSAIPGGRSTINMGRGDPAQLQRKAGQLAAALSSPPLPFPVRVVRTTHIAAQPHSTGALAARGLFALLWGLLALLFLRVARRAGADDDPDGVPAATVRGRGRVRRFPWLRLAVSAGGVGAMLLLDRIILPGVNQVELANLSANGGTGAISVPSVFALGLMPFLTAACLVELICLAVPGWRGLRHGGPRGRARMGRPVALLTILLAFAQGWMVALWLASLGHGPTYLPEGGPIYLAEVLANPGLHTYALISVSLTCGVLVLVGLAGVIDRYGLGNGISVLLLTGLVGEARGIAQHTRAQSPSPALLLFAAAGLVVLAVVTRWLLRRRASSGARPVVPMPAAGAVPLSAVFWILSLAALVMPFVRLPLWLPKLVPATGHDLVVQVALLVIAGGFLSWLFSRPAVWLPGARALGHDIATNAAGRAFARAAVLSVGWLLVVAVIYYALRQEAAAFLFGLPILLLSVAVLTDLHAEWRARARTPDLVPIWPLHQVPLAPMLAAALRERGIEHHLRGLRHRSLLHFFGPYVPIVVMVPAARAAEAKSFLEAALSGRASASEDG